MLSQNLMRGKIDLILNVECTDGDSSFSLNKELIKKYYLEIMQIKEDLNVQDHSDVLSAILRLPDVLNSGTQDIEAEEWEAISDACMVAITKTNDFRSLEGLSLEKDILGRVGLIENMLEEIMPFEKERIQAIKGRLLKGLEELSETIQTDPNRFEQELIYYLEKLDITEEKTRLTKHCEHFRQTLKNESFSGRKLGFISQEMGREINTIGSKASYAPIQKIVVQMKDELEKIKEQLLNIL